MSARLTESSLEAALAWLKAIGWRAVHGPEIPPDMAAAQRANYGEVVLEQRSHAARVQREQAEAAPACTGRL